MDKLYVLVKEHFPQFVQADYPVFVRFVQEYYKWVEQQQSVGRIEDVVDIDNTPEQFVQYFRKQLDVYNLYADASPFDSKYLKTIREVYTAKGSEQALVFLLKTVYGSDESTRIVYPRDSILRASDGVWDQERFITVRKYLGAVPSQVTTLNLEYQGGVERLNVSRFEIVDSQTTRFYFKTNITVLTSLDQVVRIVENNAVVFEGRVILSPNTIEVEEGGKNWQLGQVIIIPGSSKNTLARVAEIDNLGTIKRVEVLEYGYQHDDGETIVVSPYPIKPVGTAYDYDFDESTNTHMLSIFDNTDGTSENIIGTNIDISPDSYFLENYASETYAARVVIQITTTVVVPDESPETESSITIEDWIQSRAKLKYVFNPLTVTRGKWLNSRGIISDNFIRLQDNFYYQQYSYVIESSVLRSRYQSLLNNIHPTGNKSFSTYSMQQLIGVDVQVSTEIPFKFINVSDVATIIDDTYKDATKPLADSSTGTDVVTRLFTKAVSDASTPEDQITAKQVTMVESDAATTEELVDFDVTKSLTDASAGSDQLFTDVTKSLTDASTPADSDVLAVEKSLTDNTDPATDAIASLAFTKVLTDQQATSDTVASKDSTKELDDAAIAFQLDVSSAFDAEGYDSEDYAEFGDPASLEAVIS